jgi:hypothetical protein
VKTYLLPFAVEVATWTALGDQRTGLRKAAFDRARFLRQREGIVIARLAGSAAHLRGVSHARIKLRTAAQLLHDDPELVDALLAAERLGGLPASRRSIIALVDDRPKPEELRAKVRARRLKLARDLLAMHKSRLRREERLVKKWAAKVRRLERSVELGDGDGSED